MSSSEARQVCVIETGSLFQNVHVGFWVLLRTPRIPYTHASLNSLGEGLGPWKNWKDPRHWISLCVGFDDVALLKCSCWGGFLYIEKHPLCLHRLPVWSFYKRTPKLIHSIPISVCLGRKTWWNLVGAQHNQILFTVSKKKYAVLPKTSTFPRRGMGGVGSGRKQSFLCWTFTLEFHSWQMHLLIF